MLLMLNHECYIWAVRNKLSSVIDILIDPVMAKSQFSYSINWYQIGLRIIFPRLFLYVIRPIYFRSNICKFAYCFRGVLSGGIFSGRNHVCRDFRVGVVRTPTNVVNAISLIMHQYYFIIQLSRFKFII